MTDSAQTRRTWLVLGGSSSVARAFARAAGAQGADILLAGRDLDDLQRTAADVALRTGCRAEAVRFDAEATDEHPAFVEACLKHAQDLDVFLLFGSMPDQSAIDRDFDLALQTVAVNYVGAMSVLSRLAPHLERQGEGRIVVLSSVAGDRGRPKNYVYGSAKGGLNLYLQGLRARLASHNVSVTTIKAGFLDTDMSYGMPGLFLVASPAACAEACLKLSAKGKEIAYFPAFWWIIMTIIKSIPERIFKRLDI